MLIIEEFYSNHGMYGLHFNVVLNKLFDQDKKKMHCVIEPNLILNVTFNIL